MAKGFTTLAAAALIVAGGIGDHLLTTTTSGQPVAALASVPALILTTDPNDLSLLLDGEPEATRVALVRV